MQPRGCMHHCVGFAAVDVNRAKPSTTESLRSRTCCLGRWQAFRFGALTGPTGWELLLTVVAESSPYDRGFLDRCRDVRFTRQHSRNPFLFHVSFVRER